MNVKTRWVKLLNENMVDISPATIVLFTPFSGQVFIPLRIVARTKNVAGTVSTQPSFKITNGTVDVVPEDELASDTEGHFSVHNIEGEFIVDHDNPLKLVKTVAAAGTNPVFALDLFVEGIVMPATV